MNNFINYNNSYLMSNYVESEFESLKFFDAFVNIKETNDTDQHYLQTPRIMFIS